jgi:hypothetical protein
VSEPPRSLEELLSTLGGTLEGCSHRRRRSLLDETRDHVLSHVEEALAAGCSPEQAEQDALAAFGDAALIGAGLRSVAPRRRARGAVRVVVAALLLLAPPAAIEGHLATSSGYAATPTRVVRAPGPIAPPAPPLLGTDVGRRSFELLRRALAESGERAHHVTARGAQRLRR